MLGYLGGDSQKIVVSDDEASFSDSDDADDEEDEDEETSTLEEFEADVFDDEEESDDNIEITEIMELPHIDSPKEEQVNVEIFMVYTGPDFEPRSEVVETKHIDLMMDPAEHVISSSEISPPHFEPSLPPAIVVNKLEADESPVPFVLEDVGLHPTTTDSSTPATGAGATLGNNNKPKKSTKQSRSMVSEEGNIENMEDFNGDYSKLNVTQLRNLVTFRGLSSHASKLKKTELLQLLTGGSGGGSIDVTEIDI
jgi:hypothetical protein